MTIQTVSYPVAPAITPRSGTLLDVATVNDGIEWLDGEALFDSYNCLQFGSEAAFCQPNTKVFDDLDVWQDGFRFAAYGGVKCRAVGIDPEHMQSEVNRVFQAGESTAVERALMKTRFAVSTGNWDAPSDRTPASGPVKPAVGIALLEEYAATHYAGVPTIHVPVSVASLLMAVNGLEGEGNNVHTRLGSKIAAGAGYALPNLAPTGASVAARTAPEGERWLYATGEVVVNKGDAIVREVMAHNDNDVLVLAERGYVAAVDCFAAAVRVSVTA